jgi:hypothetical protein
MYCLACLFSSFTFLLPTYNLLVKGFKPQAVAALNIDNH